jgi:hypothetical protein
MFYVLLFTHYNFLLNKRDIPMDRDMWLILTGGLIGALSSLATVFAVYYLEGMRLRRLWDREDQVMMQKKREEIQALLAAAQQAEEEAH